MNTANRIKEYKLQYDQVMSRRTKTFNNKKNNSRFLLWAKVGLTKLDEKKQRTNVGGDNSEEVGVLSVSNETLLLRSEQPLIT